MTMATAFPLSLPRPMRAGYGYQIDFPHAETMNDRGLPRRRRMGTGVTAVMTLVRHFTEAELQTFAQWWRDDIAYGTADFEIALLNGYTDVAQDVRPKGAYTTASLIGAWEVTLAVELAEPQIASQTEMQAAIDNFDDLSEASDLYTLVHVTLPAELGTYP